MKKQSNRRFTDAEKYELWRRWQAGESREDIARALERSPPAVGYVLVAHGGIRPRPRHRSRQALTLLEREEISRGVCRCESIRSIADRLGRAPSTISRELHRNGGYAHYRATVADEATWERARRPKPCKLASHKRLRHLVSTKLQMKWSPQQISGWLKHTYPDSESHQVSHETIYRSLYLQSRGTLKKELVKELRSKRRFRHARQRKKGQDSRGQIVDAIPISQRPASVEDRAVPGHWEGDLIVGSRNSYIATLVERHSRYVMLTKVNSKETQEVVSRLIRQVKKLPDELLKSLTWDRGPELKGHKTFTLATNVAVYFCDPSSPWQKGSNENTNGLLRQYFPKGTDLSVHSQAYLNKVARELNGRPRKTLGYETPAERFNVCVASTG